MAAVSLGDSPEATAFFFPPPRNEKKPVRLLLFSAFLDSGGEGTFVGWTIDSTGLAPRMLSTAAT
jgi:hypothetical protein